MTDTLVREAADLIATMPDGPTSGQLRQRLQLRRRRRLVVTVVVAGVLVVNGLVALSLRTPATLVPAGPAGFTTMVESMETVPTSALGETDQAPTTTAPTTTEPPPATTTPTPVGNRPPTAVDDLITSAMDVPVSVQVLSNDVDPNADRLRLVSVSTTADDGEALPGTVSIIDDQLVVTPSMGFVGVFRITYSIADASGLTASAVLTVVFAAEPVPATP